MRCCLEDIVMGKLHGLMIGLDVCSTLHMDVSLDDLDWCLDQIMPANPGYLMALPTKNDPMLSYLTTAFQDHVRHPRASSATRSTTGCGRSSSSSASSTRRASRTAHFGDPTWVYLQYRRRKGDARPDAEILAEARAQITEVRKRGVLHRRGPRHQPVGPEPGARSARSASSTRTPRRASSPSCPPPSRPRSPSRSPSRTESKDRERLHPPPAHGRGALRATRSTKLRTPARQPRRAGIDVQIVVSDGLNAWALTDEGHLAPYLASRCARSWRPRATRSPPSTSSSRRGACAPATGSARSLFGSLAERDLAPRHPPRDRRAARLRAPRLLGLHHRADRGRRGRRRAWWTTTSPASSPASPTRPCTPTAAAMETVNILKQMAPR